MSILPDAPPRVSEHGAKVAAGRLGITVEEYRRHEAAGEFWCGLGRHWVAWPDFRWTGRTGNSRSGRCADCDNADQRRRYTPQRAYVPNLRNIHYAGPAFSKGQRISLTPEGASAVGVDRARSASCAPAVVPSGHSSCPPSIRHLCRGELPVGWVRAGASS